jgi:PAS domain S-box-containing protein
LTSDIERMAENSDAGDAPRAAFALSFDYASLLDAVPAMIAVHEGHEHRFIYSNPAHDRAVGHRPLFGIALRNAMSELAGQNVFERFDRVYQTGVADEQAAFRTTVETAQGESATRYYSQILQPWRGVDGEIRGVISFAYDVTDQVEAKEAVARRQAELEFALDVGGGIGTWDWDIAADTVRVDERLATLFGLPPTGAVGLPLARFLEGVLPEDRAEVGAAITASVETRADYLQEYRVLSFDGEVHWVTARGRCIYDDQGTPMRFPGVVVDITKQVEARSELERTYALLSSFLDNSASYVFAKDLEGRYILANRFYLDAFGETEASLYGRTDRDRFGEDDTFSVNDRRVAETGVPIEFEEQAVDADGQTIHAISIKFPLRDGNGAIFATGSISTDITARKNAEHALELSEGRRERAMEAGSVGTFEYLAQEDRIIWDSMAYAIFGFDAAVPVTPEIITAAVHPDDRNKRQEKISASLDPTADGKYWTEFRVRRMTDGKLRWIEARGETSFVEARPHLMLGTVRDITERKDYEERLRLLNRELRHRVKNLFAVTGAMIRMAGREEPAMQPFADRLGARINSLAAAHTVGLDTESEEPLNFSDMIAAVLRPFLEDRRETIRLVGQSVSIPRRIVTPLSLVIYELTTNAFKHGCLAQTGGELRIDWHLRDGAGGAAGEMLEISWHEKCPQNVSLPSESEEGGFGSRLIAGSVIQMNASFDRSVQETGIHIKLMVPLEITES